MVQAACRAVRAGESLICIFLWLFFLMILAGEGLAALTNDTYLFLISFRAEVAESRDGHILIYP